MPKKQKHSLWWAIRVLRKAGFKRAADYLARRPVPAPPKPTPKPVPPKRVKLPVKPARQRLVYWAKWGVHHTAEIHYSEGADRYNWSKTKRGTLPISTDCSGFVAMCYKWAGLPDPSGDNFQAGYTGTLLANAEKNGHILTDISKALPGDLIVYGPGTGSHVAMIVEAGADPLTISHGSESGPEYVRVSQDGRQPQRICRYL